MKRKRPGRFKTILIVTGCVLLSPIIVPYFLIENAFADRRRIRDADDFHCIHCGNVPGQTAIAQADEYWREHVRELHLRFPSVRLRWVRDVWAICTVCGATRNYRNKDRTDLISVAWQPRMATDGKGMRQKQAPFNPSTEATYGSKAQQNKSIHLSRATSCDFLLLELRHR